MCHGPPTVPHHPDTAPTHTHTETCSLTHTRTRSRLLPTPANATTTVQVPTAPGPLPDLPPPSACQSLHSRSPWVGPPKQLCTFQRWLVCFFLLVAAARPGSFHAVTHLSTCAPQIRSNSHPSLGGLPPRAGLIDTYNGAFPPVRTTGCIKFCRTHLHPTNGRKLLLSSK